MRYGVRANWAQTKTWGETYATGMLQHMTHCRSVLLSSDFLCLWRKLTRVGGESRSKRLFGLCSRWEQGLLIKIKALMWCQDNVRTKHTDPGTQLRGARGYFDFVNHDVN